MLLITKSILASIFLAVGLVAVILMLTLMGKAERKMSPVALRKLHKVFGAIFLGLFLVISYFCLKYVKMAGENLSVRAVFHGVLALALLIVFALKIAIVQFYKEFMRFVPAMGLTLFALAFLVFSTSAGHFFLTSGGSYPTGAYEQDFAVGLSGDAESGRVLFGSKCSFCHYADRDEPQIGPGLKAVLKKERLTFSGRPATPENIRQQLMNPFKNMPSFKSTLTEEQIKQLLAYLETL